MLEHEEEEKDEIEEQGQKRVQGLKQKRQHGEDVGDDYIVSEDTSRQ